MSCLSAKSRSIISKRMTRIPSQTPAASDLVNRASDRPDQMDHSTLQPQVSGRQIFGSLAGPGFFNSISSLSSSIALRFGGFTATLEAMIDPLTRPIPQRLVADFFTHKLPEIAELAAKNPAAAHRIISAQMESSSGMWGELVLVACGDGSALARALDCIESSAGPSDSRSLADCVFAVARQRPLEGRHLLRHAFAHADIYSQIYMLRKLVLDESVGSMRLVGDLFLKMMEGSNAVEREESIYPALRSIVSDDDGLRSPRRGFLDALFRGWLSECPSGR